MEPIRLLIVDDQRLMRDGLRTLMELEPDLEVAGEAEDGLAALEQYAALQPDVVLMDIRMPRLDGVEATRRLRQRCRSRVQGVDDFRFRRDVGRHGRGDQDRPGNQSRPRRLTEEE